MDADMRGNLGLLHLSWSPTRSAINFSEKILSLHVLCCLEVCAFVLEASVVENLGHSFSSDFVHCFCWPGLSYLYLDQLKKISLGLQTTWVSWTSLLEYLINNREGREKDNKKSSGKGIIWSLTAKPSLHGEVNLCALNLPEVNGSGEQDIWQHP